MSAWVFILMSSGCSVLVAHLLRYNEFRKLNTLRVLTVNYLFAAGVAFLTSSHTETISALETGNLKSVLLLAAIVGIIFIANFFIYSKSVFLNGVGISVAAMRISLIIPVLLSTFWYQEYIMAREWAGVALVFVTLYLLLPEKKSLFKVPFHAAWLLVLLFIFTGIGDSSLKVFEVDFSGFVTKEQFMGLVFISSFLVGVISMMLRQEWQLTKNEIILGLIIGIPNLYSAIFLIEALSLMSGAIVYTAANLFTVIGATALGVFIWSDKINRLQWFGLALTIISIILLIR